LDGSNESEFPVLNKGYTYACLCGVGYSNTTRLSRHFREYTYINDIYCTTKGSENSLLFDNDNPIVSRITGWCGGVLNTSSALVTYNKLESGFSEKTGKDNPNFCYYIPDKKDSRGDNATTRYSVFDITKKCRFIDRMINENWAMICKLIDSKKYLDRKELDEWGARTIQCGRKEISVTKEDTEALFEISDLRRSKGNGCWKNVCKRFNIPTHYMDDIVAFARKKSKEDVGSSYKFGSFSIILTNDNKQQEKRLGLETPTVQFLSLTCMQSSRVVLRVVFVVFAITWND
jgi:hypothetical protein